SPTPCSVLRLRRYGFEPASPVPGQRRCAWLVPPILAAMAFRAGCLAVVLADAEIAATLALDEARVTERLVILRAEIVPIELFQIHLFLGRQSLSAASTLRKAIIWSSYSCSSTSAHRCGICAQSSA